MGGRVSLWWTGPASSVEVVRFRMLTHQLFLLPEINVTRGPGRTVQTQITSDKAAHELLCEGLRKYLQWAAFITQIFLSISLQPRPLPLLGDHQETGGGDGPRERERGGERDHPVSVDKSDHTDQLILSPSPVFKTPTLLLLLLLLLSPVLKCPTPPVGDDINILDVLLVGDGHRYIFCDIESQRPDTVGK